MFRHTDEPRHPHPSDRIDDLANGLLALALCSGACLILGIVILLGWL